MSTASFSLAQKGNKLIVKTLVDVKEPEELQGFFRAYSDVVKQHSDTRDKLIVLLDISSLTITLLNPKLQVLKAITDFFVRLKPFSDMHVAAVAIMIANDKLAQIIRSSMEIYPSEVKTTVSPHLNHCKQFLKLHSR
jgi:hypothetical protein